MNKKLEYECIEKFEIPILDENGSCTDDYMIIKKSDVYTSDGTYILCGAECRLINDDNFIEISKERLEKNFKLVKECD